MFGKVQSACLQGIEGRIIEVEIDISGGLPQMNLVGLADTAIKESGERVRAGLRNCGFQYPMERITVNLAPADLRKEGTSFDLAIAVGILITGGQLSLPELDRTLLIGELALDGTLRSVPGVLSMVHAAKLADYKRVVVPHGNVREAQLIAGMEIIGIESLLDLQPIGGGTAVRNGVDAGEAAFPNKGERAVVVEREALAVGVKSAEKAGFTNNGSSHEPSYSDYADVSGQHTAKRALMIAAAGMHNILLIGPPGTGKTMLVRRLPTIMPGMAEDEALEVTKIYSAAGLLQHGSKLIELRPFRAPHHTVSTAGIVGGGSIPKPGEVSLAHRGVLFLDELPEFSRATLEALRQPIEDKLVTIGRARAVYSFPARFMLAGSMNPCPCGYLGSTTGNRICSCSPLKVEHYRSKLSGPLLDRIDLHVEVPKPEFAMLAGDTKPLSSDQMRACVEQVIAVQSRRYQNTNIKFNGELQGKLLREVCRLDGPALSMLESAFDALGLSIRAYDRILRISRTIADMEGSPAIELHHIAEALQYRVLDKNRVL